MQKSLKKVLKLIIVLIILVGLFLTFKNSLLNKSKIKFNDLVCTKTYPETENKEILTIKFDEKGIAKEYIETQIIYFSSVYEAQSIYEQAINNSTNTMDNQVSLFYDSKIELENNSIKSSFYFKVEQNQEMYNKTKEELTQYYKTVYMYECEEL